MRFHEGVEMEKVTLTNAKETLLIPLFGKAMDYRKKQSILYDGKAAEIISQINFDFDTLKIQNKTNTMMCIRAKLIDDLTQEQLKQNNGRTTVIHMGCGLDSRALRIERTHTDWYDVDFSEVIALRHMFYEESPDYHLIGSSVTETGWLDQTSNQNPNCLVVAEGLSMYLKEQEIKSLISELKNRFDRFTLIMDAYSKLTAKSAKHHPSLKRTGAEIFWGIDDPRELENWGLDIVYCDSSYFTNSRYQQQLDFGTRLMFGMANLFPAAKRAHRILTYQIG